MVDSTLKDAVCKQSSLRRKVRKRSRDQLLLLDAWAIIRRDQRCFAIRLGKQVRHRRGSLEGNGMLCVRRGTEVFAVKPVSSYLLSLGHDPISGEGEM
jgi:hypothetical protein